MHRIGLPWKRVVDLEFQKRENGVALCDDRSIGRWI
jgi:hypothetical protein